MNLALCLGSEVPQNPEVLWGGAIQPTCFWSARSAAVSCVCGISGVISRARAEFSLGNRYLKESKFWIQNFD
jgi:hypothetical protein